MWSKHCKKHGIKPIFGVELAFTPDVTVKVKRQELYWLSLLARSNTGLREIYATVEEATSHFHYVPRLPISKLECFSQDIIVLSGNSGVGRHHLPSNIYSEGHPATVRLPRAKVAVSDNYYIEPSNKPVYEVLVGRNAFQRPSPMHILDEWALRDDLDDSAFLLAERLGEECDATLLIATNVKYKSNITLNELCLQGAKNRKIELNDQYAQRMNYELSLIAEKGFEDYFFVITDMIRYAKENMVVGPARGSSCGSLVCYLLGITDIDPIPHDLIFERFIDINRSDIPDIDIDFQDNKRDMVFEYLRDKYGSDHVARLGTISRYKAKSAIGETAKALDIPFWETKQLKDSILHRSSGDSRAGFCIEDTFNDTDIGRHFMAKYPAMRVAAKMEEHARHTGMHAAGVVITNEPLTNYVARDVRNNTVHIDKYDAEGINLMKIDALGLKTLTIISETMAMVGMKHSDLLAWRIDDDVAFKVLRDRLWCGIFQFEGPALQSIARQVNIDRFDDIAALTALARPGPFASGAANEWVARRADKKPVIHLHEMTEQITKDTYGLIVYQEQVMRAGREIGLLSWKETSDLRRAMSKSLGVEFFDTYWQSFLKGALQNGLDEITARRIWDNINTMGSWAFNKAHAVAYGMVSYWTCILKGHFPREFALVTMRNTHDANPIKRYLRELDRQGYGFKPYDAMLSDVNWTFHDNSFIGGLVNVKGIGYKTAVKIVEQRKVRHFKVLEGGTTPFDNVFEGRKRFASLLAEPFKYKIYTKLTELIDINEDGGRFVFIAKLGRRNERSLNEAMFLVQRNNVKVPNDKWLNVILEDDTSTIPAVISRYKYTSLGLPLLNDHREGDWFLWSGQQKPGFRRIYVDKYRALV
jgi:DNA polymerase III alpha subunit